MSKNYFLLRLKTVLFLMLFNFIFNSYNAQTQFLYNGIRYEITSATSPYAVKVMPNGSTYSGNIVLPSAVPYNGNNYAVKSIGIGAFDACFSLTSITIPTSVVSIESSAFYDCTGLVTVRLFHTNPSDIVVSSGAFSGDFIPTSCNVYVPTGSEALFAAVNPWKTFKSISGFLAIHESIPAYKISISPNPAKDFFTLSNLKKGAVINIVDASGKSLFKTISTSENLKINTSTYSNGMYWISVDNKTEKLLITK